MGIASPQPRWRDVAAGLVLGEIAATLILVLPLLGLWWLGVAPHASTGPTLAGWPYPFEDAWSVLTDVTLLGLLAAAGAVLVAREVRNYTGRPVSTGRTALVLLLTGGAPLAWAHGLVPGELLGFIVALAAIRALAVGVEPRRLGRRTWAAVAAAALLLLASAVTFGLLHPLRIAGAAGPGPALVLGVDSPFGVRVMGVAGPSGARLSFGPVDVRIGPRGTAVVPLRLPGCSHLDGTLGVVAVSYRTLGRDERQLLTLSPPLELHCP